MWLGQASCGDELRKVSQGGRYLANHGRGLSTLDVRGL